ncbi:MAG: hypothetical protein BGO70_16545 [Bacteroidetes bacterium 43-93]|nr:hypothetical protein [Bacteroidota bacterium]OJX01372.1 MAG: hypothetical protein BGO70_16545 [Bacteroidetes bacterium 43-93]
MTGNGNKLQEQLMSNLPMLLLAGGAIYLASKILKGAGQTADSIAQALQLKKSDEQLKSERQSQQAIERYTDDVLKKQKPTRPDGFWAQLAERIYRDTRYSSSGDNHEDARYCMTYVFNDADFALLYKYYGKRQETWFGVIPDGDPKDLTMAISSNLNAKQKKSINDNYAKKGVSIRFV